MNSKVAERLKSRVPKDSKIFVENYSELVLLINHILSEKGWSKSDLANKLEKSPSEITKWLSGEHNFTLRSLAKLEAELGEKLIQIPQRCTSTKFKGDHIGINVVMSIKPHNRSTKKINWSEPTLTAHG